MTRNSAEVDAHRHNPQAEEGAAAILSSEAVVVHRRNRRVVAVVVATRSLAVAPEQERAIAPRVAAQAAGAMRLVVMVDRAAKHRWTAPAVPPAAARWRVAAARVRRALAAEASAVEVAAPGVERALVAAAAAVVVDDRTFNEQCECN